MVYLYFALSLEKTRGWIEVKANIPGAQVYVESKGAGSVGPTPYSGWLRPGKQKIIVASGTATPPTSRWSRSPPATSMTWTRG